VAEVGLHQLGQDLKKQLGRLGRESLVQTTSANLHQASPGNLRESIQTDLGVLPPAKEQGLDEIGSTERSLTLLPTALSPQTVSFFFQNFPHYLGNLCYT
jgi:hypothetical protein